MDPMKSYTITPDRNTESKQWRGKLHGYAVTTLLCMYMCRRAQMRTYMGVCMRERSGCNTVTS